MFLITFRKNPNNHWAAQQYTRFLRVRLLQKIARCADWWMAQASGRARREEGGVRWHHLPRVYLLQKAHLQKPSIRIGQKVLYCTGWYITFLQGVTATCVNIDMTNDTPFESPFKTELIELLKLIFGQFGPKWRLLEEKYHWSTEACCQFLKNDFCSKSCINAAHFHCSTHFSAFEIHLRHFEQNSQTLIFLVQMGYQAPSKTVKKLFAEFPTISFNSSISSVLNGLSNGVSLVMPMFTQAAVTNPKKIMQQVIYFLNGVADTKSSCEIKLQ